MKKVLIFIGILLIVFSMGIGIGATAFAEQNTVESQAVFEYKNCILSGSGVYREFSVKLTDELISSTGITRQEIFSPLAQLYGKLGYKTEINENDNIFTAYYRFDSLTDMFIASGINGYEVSEDTSVKTKSFFFIDSKNTQLTVFALLDEPNNLISETYGHIKNLGAKDEDIALIYSYGTPYKIVGSNATLKAYSSTESLYYHHFIMNYATRDTVIELTQHSPNTVGWYVVALGIGLVVLSVPLTICVIKYKGKK